MEKKFQKKVEDFVCAHCGTRVKGSGYTDHCPKCLWGKHVDINPGDRRSKCRGIMKPIGAEMKRGEYIIHYQCTKCGYRHKVKAASKDDFEEILKLASLPLS